MGVRYKNKNSLPSSLSLVWTKVYAHHRLKCYNCVIKGLHEYFIRMVKGNFFVIIAARCLFFVHTREREREREREKKKEREERAKTTDENFVSTKYAKRGKKTSRCYCFSAATREREREIGSETRCIITQFSVRILHCIFVDHHRLLKGDRF